jgi:hypothetical protein
MRIFFVTCALLSAVSCPSQSISIKLPLLSLVDEFSFPTIQSGIEFGISKKISWYNEAGIKYREGYYSMPDTNLTATGGFKLKSEIRYFKHTVRSGRYAGVNGFYTKDSHHTITPYYYLGDSSDERIDNFSVQKVVTGLNLVIGKIYPTRKKISIELYYGLGIRFISIRQNNKEFNLQRDTVYRGARCFTIADLAYRKDITGGRSIAPNFSFGMRLSYVFRKP